MSEKPPYTAPTGVGAVVYARVFGTEVYDHFVLHMNGKWHRQKADYSMTPETFLNKCDRHETLSEGVVL